MAIQSIDLFDTEQGPTVANRMQAYRGSAWSALCRALRGTNGDFSGVNYATFWFTSRAGALPPAPPNAYTRTGASNVYHSEKEVWQTMLAHYHEYRAMAIPNWPTGQSSGHVGPRQTAAQILLATGCQITAVYTERQPCGACEPFLSDVLPHNTPVYWHFPYVSANTKKHTRDDEDEGMLMLVGMKKGKSPDDGSLIKGARAEGNKMLKSAVKP